jgi:broad specificity phosphatase PhoE
MKLIFFRHGETEFNLSDRFQGVANSPLTSKGISQAKKINEILKSNFKISKFFISPAIRVIQTAEIASKDLNVELKIEYLLRECCYGDWEAKARETIDPLELDVRSKNRFEYKHPGTFQNIEGESYKEVYLRVIPFLAGLEKLDGDGDIAIITHNGVMIAIKKYFEKLSNEQINNLRIRNDDYFIYDTKNKTFEQKSL